LKYFVAKGGEGGERNGAKEKELEKVKERN